MLWQQQIMVCYIWLCDLVIQDSHYLHIGCVVGSKCRIPLVCTGENECLSKTCSFFLNYKGRETEKSFIFYSETFISKQFCTLQESFSQFS